MASWSNCKAQYVVKSLEPGSKNANFTDHPPMLLISEASKA